MMKQLELLGVLMFTLTEISFVCSDFIPKNATQSGNVQPSEWAIKSIDGDESTCCLAAESREAYRTSDVYGWLQVDLGNTFSVNSVTLTNSPSSDSTLLRNFIIMVSKSNNIDTQQSNICSTFNNGSSVAAGGQITLKCSPTALVGRYVTIKRQGGYRQDALSLCEVAITKIPPDGYIYLYDKPTNQTGSYNGQNSTLAVDLDVRNCAQPNAPEGQRGSWSIDLLNSYLITSLIVFNSNIDTGSSQYLSEFEVWVGSSLDSSTRTLCYNYTGKVLLGENVTLNCAPQSIGRFLNVTRWSRDNTKTIYLCEIYIKGELSTGSITTSTTTTTTASSTSKSVGSTLSSSSLTSSTTTISVSGGTQPSLSTIPTVISGSSLSSTLLSSFSTHLTAQTENTISGNTSDTASTPIISDNNKIIICVVVIVGGCLIIAGIGVGFYFLFRKYRFYFKKLTDDKQIGKVTFEHKRSEWENSEKSLTKPISPVKPPKPPPPSPWKTKSFIKADELETYVENMKSEDKFKNEFKKLPEENLDQVEIGKRSVNDCKNRFKNVLPYDHSIVPLIPEESDDPEKNYINANYITGYKNVEKMYIATQGPKAETLIDFWRMVWQQNVNLIVMTTQLKEDGKKKCEQYWPAEIEGKKDFGNISVQLTKEEVYANHAYREMEVHHDKQKGEPSRTVRQMHFLKWEDKQKPEHYLPVLSFRKRVRQLQQKSSGPIVIHCSAGIGRTGTYISLDFLLEQLKHEGQISFFQCVENLRKQRMNMVQTWKQYAFLHEAVSDHFQTGDTSVPCHMFSIPDGSKLDQQFTLLQRLKGHTAVEKSAGRETQNKNKNRNNDIIAPDDSRVYLEIDHNESDYINAIYVEGFRSKEAFILTQLPLKNTVVDFWRLIWDHHLKTVVLLNEVESTDESCSKFFPDENKTETFGPFTVETKSATEKWPSIVLSEFVLTKKDKTETLLLQQYQIRDWPNDYSTPNRSDLLLPIMNKLLTKNRSEAVVLQCTDGTIRSGLLAAAMYAAEMVKSEDFVDIFYACRVVAMNRPQIINSLEQYSFLHELTSAFMNYNDDGRDDASPYTNEGFEAVAYGAGMTDDYSNLPPRQP